MYKRQLIDRGKADEQNCTRCGFNTDRLKQFLAEQNAKLKEVVVMTVNGEGRVYFQKRGEKYKILQVEVNGQW